ncbi:MAG: hypothetical protein ACRC33_28665 [Gemmataceae bacterium]
MPTSLWPDLATVPRPRATHDMLADAAGDIEAQTGGGLAFYVDILGVGPGRRVKEFRHDCYLRVPKTGAMHLLFRVTTPFGGLWPAVPWTPEGDAIPVANTEDELRESIRRILHRDRTLEKVAQLRSTVPKA